MDFVKNRINCSLILFSRSVFTSTQLQSIRKQERNIRKWTCFHAWRRTLHNNFPQYNLFLLQNIFLFTNKFYCRTRSSYYFRPFFPLHFLLSNSSAIVFFSVFFRGSLSNPNVFLPSSLFVFYSLETETVNGPCSETRSEIKILEGTVSTACSYNEFYAFILNGTVSYMFPLFSPLFVPLK